MAPDRTDKIVIKGHRGIPIVTNGESPSNQVPSESSIVINTHKSLVEIYSVNDVPLWNKVNPNYSPNNNNSLFNKEKLNGKS